MKRVFDYDSLGLITSLIVNIKPSKPKRGKYESLEYVNESFFDDEIELN
jgi:hypothetical protein